MMPRRVILALRRAGAGTRGSAAPLLLAMILALPAAARGAQLTAIRAGRLIDPSSGVVLEKQTLIIEGDRIKAVGPSLTIPSGAVIIDLSKEWVLPGLFDCHTHLCLNMTPPRGTSDREFYEALFLTISTNSTAFRALQGVVNARTMLQAGFTTVRDLGNAGSYADTDLRRAVEEGFVPGPTIVNAGRIIAPLGGQIAMVFTPEHHDRKNPEYYYADTRDEIKKAIRENILYGAKLIKLVVDDEPYIYTTEDIRFAVDEAAKAGLKVAAHGFTRAGALNAIHAGVASVEHGYDLTDEDLLLAKQKGVTLVGTDRSEAVYRALQVPAESQAKRIQRLRRAWALGVPMAFGSDIYFDVPGHTRGSAAMTSLECYTRAGIPPQCILRLMTSDSARLLGLEAERGALRTGLYADLIATRENPLQDIRALERVDFVMKNGVVVLGGAAAAGR